VAVLKINLEEGDGCYYAHAIDLLGCFSKADSKSEAIDLILKDARQYSEWLLAIEETKEVMPKAKDFLDNINAFEIIEEFRGIPMLRDSCGTSALFTSDKELIEEPLFEFYITIINKLPENLLRIVFQYSNEERNVTIIEGRPTINEELTDFYNAEMFYIKRFGEIVEQKFFETIDMTKDELDTLSILERVIKVRQGAISLLRYYYKKLDDQVFLSQDNTEVPEEEWTIKKIVRKFIEHERERTAAIRVLVDKLEDDKAKEEKDK
jgi:predicted RNase H-like HicB family nuclease